MSECLGDVCDSYPRCGQKAPITFNGDRRCLPMKVLSLLDQNLNQFCSIRRRDNTQAMNNNHLVSSIKEFPSVLPNSKSKSNSNTGVVIPPMFDAAATSDCCQQENIDKSSVCEKNQFALIAAEGIRKSPIQINQQLVSNILTTVREKPKNLSLNPIDQLSKHQLEIQTLGIRSSKTPQRNRILFPLLCFENTQEIQQKQQYQKQQNINLKSCRFGGGNGVFSRVNNRFEQENLELLDYQEQKSLSISPSPASSFASNKFLLKEKKDFNFEFRQLLRTNHFNQNNHNHNSNNNYNKNNNDNNDNTFCNNHLNSNSSRHINNSSQTKNKCLHENERMLLNSEMIEMNDSLTKQDSKSIGRRFSDYKIRNEFKQNISARSNSPCLFGRIRNSKTIQSSRILLTNEYCNGNQEINGRQKQSQGQDISKIATTTTTNQTLGIESKFQQQHQQLVLKGKKNVLKLEVILNRNRNEKVESLQPLSSTCKASDIPLNAGVASETQIISGELFKQVELCFRVLSKDIYSLIEADEFLKDSLELRYNLLTDSFIFLMQKVWQECLVNEKEFKVKSWRKTVAIAKMDEEILVKITTQMETSLITCDCDAHAAAQFLRNFYSYSIQHLIAKKLLDRVGSNKKFCEGVSQEILKRFFAHESLDQGLFSDLRQHLLQHAQSNQQTPMFSELFLRFLGEDIFRLKEECAFAKETLRLTWTEFSTLKQILDEALDGFKKILSRSIRTDIIKSFESLGHFIIEGYVVC